MLGKYLNNGIAVQFQAVKKKNKKLQFSEIYLDKLVGKSVG